MIIKTASRFGGICIAIIVILIAHAGASKFRHIRHDYKNLRQRRQYVPLQNVTLGLQSNEPESGPWGPWTEASECSRTCGGGVSFQTRICLDQRADGSHSCVGPSKKYFSCNVQDCPPNEQDFREKQCARFDNIPFEDRYYQWEPYTKGQNPCELNCKPKSERFYYRQARKVIDGTKCYDDGSLDICVDGACMPVGCDKMLGSNTREDKCRVCGGDGTSCRLVSGVFDSNDLRIGYNDIILIPAGAINIKVQEVQPTNNYLAVRRANGDFYLNGNWRIDMSRELKFAGTTFHYERKSHGYTAPESLRVLGPTNEPLFISLLYQEKNQGISYEYSLPADTQEPPAPDSYSWMFGDYGPCSRSCGGGLQLRAVYCARTVNREPMPEYLCDIRAKPENNRTCNRNPCPPGWSIGEWSSCRCPGVQHRDVVCQKTADNGRDILLAHPDECKKYGEKPEVMALCWIKGCPPFPGSEDLKKECDSTPTDKKLDTTPEGTLTDTAGTTGTRTTPGMKDTDTTGTKVTDTTGTKDTNTPEMTDTDTDTTGTKDTNTPEMTDTDTTGTKDTNTPGMNGTSTPAMNDTDTTGTDLSELKGNATEPTSSDSASTTDLMPRSPVMEVCQMVSTVKWNVSEWDKCDSNCGKGKQTRKVMCVHLEDDKIVDDLLCDSMMRPNDTQECDEVPCSGVDWVTSEWSSCDQKCGSSIRTRSVRCATEQGEIYPDSLCHEYRKPNSSDPCINHQGCDAVWFTSEWSSCSVTCGNGTKTRFAFCGMWDDDSIITLSEDKCSGQEKPETAGDCVNDPCGPTWFAGPWEMCSGHCSDMQRRRRSLCLTEDGPDESCPPNMEPPAQEPCKGNSSCEELDDGVLVFGGCANSTYGCCPDGLTARKENFENCPPIDVLEGCEKTEFGCCRDGETAAFGPFQKGCPVNCTLTRYGCCQDGVTPANGTNFEGCEVPPECLSSKFGCCPDGQTPAEGPNEEGCDMIKVEPCGKTEFGCCSDGQTPAKGLDKEGCMLAEVVEGSGDDCIEEGSGEGSGAGKLCTGTSTVGTDPTTGTSPETTVFTDCTKSTFGCCADGITAALGENLMGCPEELECNATEFGCCPDGVTSALGINLEGCPDNGTQSTFVSTVTSLFSTITNLFTDTPDTMMTDDLNTTMTDDLNTTMTDDLNTTMTDDLNTTMTEPELENVTDTTTLEPIITDCAKSEYGCCPDNATKANGPGGYGCPCDLFPYGCCPDRRTPARGERYYGCTCHQYPYGCCQDKYTPARGPDFDGCLCERMLYGCCLDGITPAAGPNREGCHCENTTYGCCPDGRTIARGPNYAGCPCEIMPHGCCSDRKTAARGPDFEGCPCETLPNGCCPDGRSPAKGPRYEGCPCVNSPYGCCPDGVTVALGPKFEGCPSGPTLDNKLSAEACSLPKERGSCQNYTVKWYFDEKYGGCTRFWYGGCEGNANRFKSQEECERICVKPEGALACVLPKVKGPCEANQLMFYFDKENKQCQQFYYGGCLGNKNKFENREECENLCVRQDLLDACEQEAIHGPCQGKYTRWYFSKPEGRCKQFVYGGCHGNKNNFETETECRSTCVSLSPTEICRLPKAEGHCLASYPRWYYDFNLGSCQEFTYSGCEGNHNRFIDKSTCESACNSTRRPQPTNICELDKAEGTCGRNLVKWYYNKQARRCEQFYYGGCEGNGNQFDERDSCERACIGEPAPTTENVCELEKEPGNCYNFQERWYFDAKEQQCHRFYYSGCAGNGNNFGTFQECDQRCGRKTQPTQVPTVDFKTEYCVLPSDHGPCERNDILWFYDKNDGVCKQFYYGGCQGNHNKFNTRRECETKCWNSQDICKLPKVKGPCSADFTQWFYDEKSNECEEFIYGGCQGNANKFSSKDTCESQCKKVSTPPTPTDPGSRDHMCNVRPDPGPCKEYLPHYYYSTSDNSCRLFIYGGCGGNTNRFASRNVCEEKCIIRRREPDDDEPKPEDDREAVCRKAADAGPCTETHARWYYDAAAFTCLPFIYGGCAGNKNRFKSYDNCITYCNQVKPTEAPPPPDARTPGREVCPPSSCEDNRCPFGVDEYTDEFGCKQCRCHNPCLLHECPVGMRCAVEGYRAATGEPKAQAVCRLINKPGECPTNLPEPSDRSRDCVDRCRNDADCRNGDKCCSNGCAMICVVPSGVSPSTTERPVGRIPIQDDYEEVEIIARAGTDVVLDCGGDNHGLKSSWSRDGQPIYFVSDLRVQLMPNGSLLIKSVEPDDIGTYACSVSDERGATSTRFRKVIVHEPVTVDVQIASEEYKTGTNLQIDCVAHGYPAPEVKWFLGTVQLQTNDRLTILPNNTLIIKGLNTNDSGEYKCTAANGYNENSATVPVKIDDVYVPPDCKDSPFFANCPLVVRVQYCTNQHYAKFCCRSCLLAGQLDKDKIREILR